MTAAKRRKRRDRRLGIAVRRFTGREAPGITPDHTDIRVSHQMRAEIEQASDAAKQSIGLLRRHL
jgi:hypothetical protein